MFCSWMPIKKIDRKKFKYISCGLKTIIKNNQINPEIMVSVL